jgi:hypothetical protein
MMVDFVGVLNKVTGVTSLGFAVTLSSCVEEREKGKAPIHEN